MNIIFSEEEKIKYLSTNIVFPEIFQLFSLLDYEYKIEILHFCFTMAKADRDYSEKEKSLIYSIASEIGFDVLKKDKIENYFDYLDKINSYQSSMIALRAELYQR